MVLWLVPGVPRFEALAPFLGERDRRLCAASEAYAVGRGGIMAVSAATGIARSTIGRGLAELGYGKDQFPGRIRRPGGGRRPKTITEPGLLDALAELVQLGQSRCPDAERLQRNPEDLRVITADCGGSNGARVRRWKTELQALADQTGRPITVAHLPPGTGKWNRIEHRLSAFIT